MRYLIFGGTGSLGKQLIERLASWNRPHDAAADVVVYSRDEAKHWSLRNELQGRKDIVMPQFIVGDIRDRSRVVEAIRLVGPDVVIVAAALKQVDTCELSPNESVLTNIVGTQNVVSAVNDLNNELPNLKLLFVSTDKACSPVNVYGMCKATSERIVTSASARRRGTTYLCTRYGNVLESRGSIMPLFKYQALNSPALTVTDPDMTRFLMTLDDSVDLIETALERGQSGQTWVPKLPAMRIGDLAELFSERYGKPIKVIGLRPGEKLHEDLINESESVRTILIGHPPTHYVIGPAHLPGTGRRFTYSSNDTVLTKEQLKAKLEALGMFERGLDTFKGISVEEIVTKRDA